MKKLYLILLLSVISVQVHSDILSEDLIQVCELIGYESNTEELGGCVLALRDKAKLNKIAALKQQHRKAAEAKFAAMHNLQQRQYEQQLSAYHEQQRQYEEQQAKIKKQKAINQNLKQMELGLRMMAGQSLVDASMATAGMQPLPKPEEPDFQNLTNESWQTNLPDGSFYNCTYNPMLKIVDCF